MGACDTSRTEKRSKSRTGAVPRGSDEPRGRLVFFAGLGGLRLRHVVDFTREPVETQEVVDLFVS